MGSNQVYECSNCIGRDCHRCGGTGYRRVCKSRECNEYGCDGSGGCHATKEDFDSQQARAWNKPSVGFNIAETEKLMEQINRMTPEQRNAYFNGVWRVNND